MKLRRLMGAGGIVTAMLTAACGQGESASSTSEAEGRGSAPAQFAMPRAAGDEAGAGKLVEITPPTGWTSAQRQGWLVWTSEDRRATLAVSQPARPGSATATPEELAGVLGVSDIQLNAPQALTLGPDQIPAQAADGACRFPSGQGSIAVSTLAVHPSQQVVIAYSFESTALPEARDKVMMALAALRKKR